MISLLIILFFAATGVTLNHPEWVFGSAETKREVSGQLPAGWQKAGKVDWLTVVEALRKDQLIHGTAEDMRDSETEASVTFKAPGYSADTFIEVPSGAYKISISASGPVAILNDLHRGTNTGKIWPRIIDLSGVLLILLSVTGLGMMFYLKKVRVPGLALALLGALITLLLMKLAS